MTTATARKGIDHSFASALKQTRAEGKPENTISRNASKGKGRAVTPADKQALARELAKTAADIQGKWILADANEAQALTVWEAANIALENTKVIKARVAYAAAMLVPFKGEASMTSAVKVLHAKDYATDKWTKTQVDGKKNTLRPYVEAGKALAGKGWHLRTTQPDEEERALVVKAIREAGRKAKAEDPGNPGDPGKEPGDNNPGGQDSDPDMELSYHTLLGHVARLNASLDNMIKGDIVVSEREAGELANMLAEFGSKLAAYADGK